MDNNSQARSSISVNSRTTINENSLADMEVFKEIDQFYFSNSENLDPKRYILEKAPTQSDCTAIEEMFIKLKRQQQVVSSKALHLITQKRDACDKEFLEITTIQQQLQEIVKVCRLGRQELKIAKSNLTVSTFAILANFRKKQIVQSLLKSLNTIRNLRQAEDEVQYLVRNREYEAAVRLVLAGQKAAAEHRHFKCVAALTQKLQDTLELAEEQLDVVLADICYNFDTETFTKLQKAYLLLNKTQVAMDQLHMHFSSAINNTAIEAMKAHQKNQIENSGESVKFKELCTGVKDISAISCLLDLCDNLWWIMLSYYQVVSWHDKQDEYLLNTFEYTKTISDFEVNINKEYVKEKLKSGLLRIWQDVQMKISTYLTESDLSQYSFEKFIRVLGILKRLISVGEEFCGDTSENLQSFIKVHTVTYIKNYHAGRMEVLRIFLENDGWEMCPVKSSFNVMHLQEFDKLKRHIKASLENITTVKSRDTPNSFKTHSSDAGSSAPSDSIYIGRYFTGNCKHSPFYIYRNSEVIDEDIMENEFDNDSEDQNTDMSDDDEPDELKRDFVDETPSGIDSANYSLPSVNKGVLKKSVYEPVIVTNTTISVLRDFGQYLQMCRFLKQVSFEVIMLMTQMFDYYFYSVHFFFASDLKVSSSTLYSSKLNWILKRISNNITFSEESDIELLVPEEDNQGGNVKYLCPQISQNIDLKNSANLHGLSERLTAMESLIFVSKQLEYLRPYLDNLVLPHQKIILQIFYEQTVSATADLRVPIYMSVASKMFEVRSILIAMSQVNWEVKNIMSQHSAYVDQIVREVQVFSMRLDQIGQKVPISIDVHKSLWSAVSKFIIHTLVEGFSNVSKCSDSGRGLMQLDYTQLLSKLEKISGIKPAPFQEYVDVYVKAYYLPKVSLETFVSEHKEYSIKHLTALVNCSCESKKVKQELIAMIEGKENNTNK